MDAAPILEKIFLKQRYDLVSHDRFYVVCILATYEECVSDPVLPIDQVFDAIIDRIEDGVERKGGRLHSVLECLHAGIGSQFLEPETPPQCCIEQRDGPVRRVHGPDHMQVRRDTERLLRVW